MPQFKSISGVTTLVPQIVAGSLEPPIKLAGPSPGVQWDAERLVSAIEEKGEPGAADALRALLQWVSDRHLGVKFGHGSEWGTATLFIPIAGEPRLITIWVPGSMQWPFGSYRAPFDTPQRRQGLLAKVAAITGIRWTTGTPPTSPERFPATFLAPFAAPAPFAELTNVLDWMVSEMKHVGGT